MSKPTGTILYRRGQGTLPTTTPPASTTQQTSNPVVAAPAAAATSGETKKLSRTNTPGNTSTPPPTTVSTTLNTPAATSGETKRLSRTNTPGNTSTPTPTISTPAATAGEKKLSRTNTPGNTSTPTPTPTVSTNNPGKTSTVTSPPPTVVETVRIIRSSPSNPPLAARTIHTAGHEGQTTAGGGLLYVRGGLRRPVTAAIQDNSASTVRTTLNRRGVPAVDTASVTGANTAVTSVRSREARARPGTGPGPETVSDSTGSSSTQTGSADATPISPRGGRSLLNNNTDSNISDALQRANNLSKGITTNDMDKLNPQELKELLNNTKKELVNLADNYKKIQTQSTGTNKLLDTLAQDKSVLEKNIEN